MKVGRCQGWRGGGGVQTDSSLYLHRNGRLSSGEVVYSVNRHFSPRPAVP